MKIPWNKVGFVIAVSTSSSIIFGIMGFIASYAIKYITIYPLHTVILCAMCGLFAGIYAAIDRIIKENLNKTLERKEYLDNLTIKKIANILQPGETSQVCPVCNSFWPEKGPGIWCHQGTLLKDLDPEDHAKVHLKLSERFGSMIVQAKEEADRMGK